MSAHISIILSILAVCYLAVLVSILADLLTGLRKACKSGMAITSRGFRRTVAKLSSYYAALFALSGVDAMLIASSYGLALFGARSFPPFPYITTLGSIGLALIEVKSIVENSNLQPEIEALSKIFSHILTFWKGLKL